MIRYNSILIGLVILACIIQQFVPPIGILHDMRILIVPVVFLCASLTGGLPMMLGLAFLSGFLWDCQHTLSPHTGSDSVYLEKVESISFGYSIVIYAIMGAFAVGVTPLFRSGKWQIPTLVIGFSVYFYLWIEYTLISIVRGDFVMTSGVFLKISYTSILSTLMVPPMLKLLEKIANLCNHMIKNDDRRRWFSPDKI